VIIILSLSHLKRVAKLLCKINQSHVNLFESDHNDPKNRTRANNKSNYSDSYLGYTELER